MRLKQLRFALIGIAATHVGSVFAQERSVLRPLPCMSCTANAPETNLAPQADEQHPIVPSEDAEMEIALGRLRLVRDHFRIVRNHVSFPGGKGERALQVSFHHGEPALRASYRDPNEKWALQFDNTVGAQWTREYTADGRPIKVVYTQKPHQPVEIQVSGIATNVVKIRGLSLWHLMAQNPPGFTTCVLPSLERLNASWNLRDTLATARVMSEKVALADDLMDSETIAQCVTDLESSDQPTRAAALERLQRAGLAIHVPLQRLMQSDLSVQQRQSLERLLDGLEPTSADTPTRLAYWLSGDPGWR